MLEADPREYQRRTSAADTWIRRRILYSCSDRRLGVFEAHRIVCGVSRSALEAPPCPFGEHRGAPWQRLR